MKITDEARKLIEREMREEGCTGIRLLTVHSCCGESLRIRPERAEETGAQEINGIRVWMDEETRGWTDAVTLDADDDQLTLHNKAACCG